MTTKKTKTKKYLSILAMSDIHEQWSDFEPDLLLPKHGRVDILLIAGDSTNIGRRSIIGMMMFQEFLERWRKKCDRILFIPGNHDIGVEDDNLVEDVIYKKNIASCYNIMDARTELPSLGLNIIGMSMSPCYDYPHLERFWDNMTADEKVENAYYKLVPRPVRKEFLTIFLSHTPPYGVLDSTRYGQVIGSKALGGLIEEVKPELIICGHVHEQRGQAEVIEATGTTVLNVATTYKFLKLPIDPETGKVKKEIIILEMYKDL